MYTHVCTYILVTICTCVYVYTYMGVPIEGPKHVGLLDLWGALGDLETWTQT